MLSMREIKINIYKNTQRVINYHFSLACRLTSLNRIEAMIQLFQSF